MSAKGAGQRSDPRVGTMWLDSVGICKVQIDGTVRSTVEIVEIVDGILADQVSCNR